MSKKIGLNNIIYITGQPREWVIKNIYKLLTLSRFETSKSSDYLNKILISYQRS